MLKKRITKDTVLYVSIAQRPSNFGTTLFNAAFEHEGVDAIYKALQVKPGQLREAVAGIRALGIRGCGVSMPFKTEIVRYLDRVDLRARRIGAVNTIVNTGNRLIGYNTDYVGAYTVLKPLESLTKKTVMLLGVGGVAQAISCALKDVGAKRVIVLSRSAREGKSLVRKWGFESYWPWVKRNSISGDILINATPIGMAPSSDAPVTDTVIDRFEVVMDVVINPLETKLMKMAARKHKRVLPGYRMSLYQAARQFELYTGKPAPVGFMEEQIKKVYNP